MNRYKAVTFILALMVCFSVCSCSKSEDKSKDGDSKVTSGQNNGGDNNDDPVKPPVEIDPAKPKNGVENPPKPVGPISLPSGMLGVCLDRDGLMGRFLSEALLLPYMHVEKPFEALKVGNPAAIIEATPETLKLFTGKEGKSKLKAYTDAGGWAMLWSLTPEGLADFNKIVGVDHILRPFEAEEVDRILASKEPLVKGLKRRWLFMETGLDSGGDVPVLMRVDNAWSYVVDYDEIAPFCKFPNAKYWNAAPEESIPGQPHCPRSMVNGLVNNWRWAFLIRLDRNEPTKWTIELPRAETLEQFSIHPQAGIWHKISEIHLTYGDETKPVVLAISAIDERQDYDIPVRKTEKLTIEIAKWQKTGKGQNIIGVMNLWIKAKRSKEFYKKVIPLLTTGVLVKYPMGKGGIVLNQMQIVAIEDSSRNRTFKREIMTKLVENMINYNDQ
ncbi:MAG TPA: hypothetical protein ENL03_02665 [Phycisphaerae bacterium]|nr:hypothetical protein [Phycisphaerae bacterium]